MTYICLNDNFESYLVIDIYLENDHKSRAIHATISTYHFNGYFIKRIVF